MRILLTLLLLPTMLTAGTREWSFRGPMGSQKLHWAMLDPSDPSALWVQGSAIGLRFSLDGNQTFVSQFPGSKGQNNFFNTFTDRTHGAHGIRHLLHEGRFYRSEDGGRTWFEPNAERLFKGEDVLVKSHPSDPNAVLVGHYDAPCAVDCEDPFSSLAVTVDGGTTWQELGQVDPGGGYEIKSLDFHPQSVSVFYVVVSRSTGDDVLLRHNSDSSWQVMENVPSGINRVLANPTQDGHLVLDGSDGFHYESLDDGETWQMLGFLPVGSRIMKFDAQRQGRLWFSIANQLWLRENDESHILLEVEGLKDSSGFRMMDVTADGRMVAVHELGLWFSTGSDTAWEPLDHHVNAAVITDLIFSGNPEVLFAKGTRRLFRSQDNGGSWQTVTDSSGEVLNAPDKIQVDPFDEDTLYGIGNGLVVSYNAGQSWQQLLPDTFVFGVHRGQQNLLLANDGEGLKRSEDGGQTWSLVATPFADQTGLGVTHLAFEKQAPYRVFGMTPLGESDMVVSHDGGQSWTARGGKIIGPKHATWFEIDPHSGEHLYIGSDSNWRSYNAGESWVPLEFPIRNGACDFEVNPGDDADWVVTNQVDLKRLIGLQWIETRPPAFHGALAQATYDPSNQNRLYAVGDGGIWRYNDTAFSLFVRQRIDQWPQLSVTNILTQALEARR